MSLYLVAGRAHLPSRPTPSVISRPTAHGTTPPTPATLNGSFWHHWYQPATDADGRSPTPRRDVVDAIRYLDRTGSQWDALPADFPHHKLVYQYFKPGPATAP